MMKPLSRTSGHAGRPAAIASVALALCAMLCATMGATYAAGCAFEPQGEGRVAAIIDARSFRLEDGREVLLAGIEPIGTEKSADQKPDDTAALSAVIAGREVTLSGQDDTPDRYGRQPAFVFVAGSETPVQVLLLAQGAALASPTVTDKDCASVLAAAEAGGRNSKLGGWGTPSAIKNAESPGDILAGTGRFIVVEGKVLSVRQSGATTYLNFGRNWTQDFAVTVSRRTLPLFEKAGIALKSFENRRVRVRGWVEARNGPRIEVLSVGQIELLGGG